MTSAEGSSTTKGELLYGEVSGELVFIPRSQVEWLLPIQHAIATAKTWGEFWSLLPSDARENYLEWWNGDRELFEERLAFMRKIDPDLTETEIREEWEDEVPSIPPDDEPFSFTTARYIREGDWPGWPDQEMLDWVPKSIQERFGTIGSSMVSGAMLELKLRDAPEIVKAFETLGYRCIRDDDAVARASGF